MFDFFLVKTADGYLIDVADNLATEFVKRLTFYKLRAKVEIELLEDKTVTVAWGNGIIPRDGWVRDPRHDSLGVRLYSTKTEGGEEADYQAHRISLGVPEGGIDFEYGDAYPHETLMDQFAGIDFKKGCYVGQEVVSRMQHRGTTKKRIVHIEANTPLPATGTPILADGKPAGTVGSVKDTSGLALVRLDRVARAEKVEADGIIINARIPDWVNFDFPETT